MSAPGAPDTDVLVDVDPGSPLGDLAEHLGARVGVAGRAERWRLYLDGAELDPATPVQLSPLRDGVRIDLREPGRRPREPQGVVEVRVVSGPGAGQRWRLGPGVATVGASASDRIHLGELPAAAATLNVQADGHCAVAPSADTPATLESESVSATVPWPSGHLLSLGPYLLDIATPDFPDASLHPSEDGSGLDYSRPPRLAPAERSTQFTLPPCPRPNDPRPMPWVMAIVPLVAALVMAKLFGNLLFLAFAFLSPISLLANHLSDRRHGRRTFRSTLAEYTRRRASIVADAEAALAAEQAQRRHHCPDPAVIGLIATGPRQRLWERRRRDEDRLLLRLGTGTLPSEVVLNDPDREEHHRRVPLELHEVPVTTSLAEHGVIGIAGRTEQTRALGRWLVAQAATLHSPADVGVCVLTEPGGAESWSWAGWLPHARPRDGQQTVALLGTNADTTARRISELLAQLTARQSAVRAAGSGATLDAPDILVVLDGSRRLRALPGVAQILADGPAVGIRSICLDTEPRLLPEECRAVAVFDGQGSLTLRQDGADDIAGVRPDLVTVSWSEAVARGMAPIRDVTRDDDDALPPSCRLLDVLGLEPPTADRIVAGWRVSGRSSRATIGASLDCAFSIDLVADGPHGLIAGTTGSGKSELLQSLVASLAVANRPDAMTFILVDYKGGSAFADCAKLPHTVGMVTDLDTHLVGRALESLGAELRRREHLFAAAGVPGLPEYEAARQRDPSLGPLPRLLIVIDEFASLARELPEFVSGLVNVAQRGRSLGIHLILATQRPSGVVSPEIRANTNLRIALRVTDTTESTDIIDAPDAARILKSMPGRAYARLGHNSLLPFQAGRIGGRRPSAVATSSAEPFVAILGQDSLGLPRPNRPEGPRVPDLAPTTDLSVLVDAIRQANDALGIAPQPSPWLPPLSASVLLEDLHRPDTTTDRAGTLRPAPFAVTDVPSEQRREVWSVDLADFGHLFVAGAPRTGRSQTLRTIAASLARENSSRDVHLFGLDCGNGALLALRALPHCGAVVRSGETERARRLIDRLTNEMRSRMTHLGERHVTDISEQRATAGPDERLPHLILLIDRWEGFLASLGEQDAGFLTDAVMQLGREGASVGIHLIVSGDQALLGGRIGALTESKLVLRLADKSDYSLIGIPGRQVADGLPAGRAYRAQGGHQTQVALLDLDPSGAAQAAAIERIGAAARARDGELPPSAQPFGVDVLPSRITFEQAWTWRTAEPTPLAGLLAVGGDRLAAYGPDLADGTPAFVVAGPPRSGRSTALRTLAASYLRIGTRVVLVAPRTSPLRDPFPGPGQPVAVLTGSDLDPDALRKLLLDGGPVVLLVDDAELLRDCAAAAELSAIVRRQLGEDVGLVLAGDADSVCAGFSGWQVEARKARRGLLLSPQNITDADLIGIRLPRTSVGNPIQPGRGILHLGNGEPLVVQVPIASE
ncbi:FtsK/SpoIIIE domain-containing protein [Sporichthya brevicatena]|uniref:FtsK/SpoIIIE domain-containing protein n=1 Tax=Sporichthya brevicatena TaxID=171442 RepID=UPI0031DF0E81